MVTREAKSSLYLSTTWGVALAAVLFRGRSEDCFLAVFWYPAVEYCERTIL